MENRWHQQEMQVFKKEFDDAGTRIVYPRLYLQNIEISKASAIIAEALPFKRVR